MKKSGIFLLIILSIVSCTSTSIPDEALMSPEVMLMEEKVIQTTTNETEESSSKEELAEPVIEKEAPLELDAVGIPVEEEVPVEKPEESKVDAESGTVLKGKELIDELSGEILKEERKVQEIREAEVSEASDTLPVVVAPEVEELFGEDIKQVYMDEVEELVESTQESSFPEMQPPAGPEADDSLDDGILSILVEMIVIIVLFTFSTIIRNKNQRPLGIGISIILSLLLALIPLLVSLILFGFDYRLLGYLILVSTIAIFRSKEGRRF